MRITIYTSLQTDWLALHQINSIKKEFENVTVVAVNRSEKEFLQERIQTQKKLIKKRGLIWFIKKRVDNYFLRPCSSDWNRHLEEQKQIQKALLKTEEIPYDHIVSSVNGKNSAQTILDTEPDLLIQAGAGILKSNIFNIPAICTLNVHGAIAPRLRGGSSIFWSYYFGRPDWLGVTVHQIDKGIDTGAVYKRQTLSYTPGIHPAGKLVESAITGTDLLCSVIGQIQKRDIIAQKIEEESTYLGFYNSKQYNSLKNNNWYPIKTTK